MRLFRILSRISRRENSRIYRDKWKVKIFTYVDPSFSRKEHTLYRYCKSFRQAWAVASAESLRSSDTLTSSYLLKSVLDQTRRRA